MVSYLSYIVENDDCEIGLNPCCNGRWSRTLLAKLVELLGLVLILVVMEDGLVQHVENFDPAKS